MVWKSKWHHNHYTERSQVKIVFKGMWNVLSCQLLVFQDSVFFFSWLCGIHWQDTNLHCASPHTFACYAIKLHKKEEEKWSTLIYRVWQNVLLYFNNIWSNDELDDIVILKYPQIGGNVLKIRTNVLYFDNGVCQVSSVITSTFIHPRK